jgi:hypothetical protein
MDMGYAKLGAGMTRNVTLPLASSMRGSINNGRAALLSKDKLLLTDNSIHLGVGARDKSNTLAVSI